MEDADVEWETQGHSDSKESNGKVSWLLNTGLWLGKKAVIAGFIVSSAPLVLPPLVVFTTLGLACSVPFGLVFASYACTEKLMSKLLPSPSSSSIILESDENEEELEDLEDMKGRRQLGFRKNVTMEEEEEEEVKDTVNGVVMRIELTNEDSNEFQVGDILHPGSGQNAAEMRVRKPVDEAGGVAVMGNEIEDKDSDTHQQRNFGKDDLKFEQNGVQDKKPVDKAGGVVAMGNEIKDKDSDTHHQRDFGQDDLNFEQDSVQEEHEKCRSVEEDQTEEMIEGSAISMESDPNSISEFERFDLVKYGADDNRKCGEIPEGKGMEETEQMDYTRSGVLRSTELDETSTQGIGKRIELDFGHDDLDFWQNGVQEKHYKCQSEEEDQTEDMMEASAISMESDPNIISEFEQLDLVKYDADDNQKCVTPEGKGMEEEEQMEYTRSGVPRRTGLDDTCTQGVGKRIELTGKVRNELGVGLLQEDVDYRLYDVEQHEEKPVEVVNETVVNYGGCEDDFNENSQGEAEWKLEEPAALKNKVPVMEQERYKESLSEICQVMVVVERDTKSEGKQGIEELKESEKVVLVARKVVKGNVVVQEDEELIRENTGIPEKIRDADKDGHGMKGSCELGKIVDRNSIELVDSAASRFFDEKDNETVLFSRDMEVPNVSERGSIISGEFDASTNKTDKPSEERKLGIGNVLGEVKGMDTENKDATVLIENKFVVKNRKPVEEIYVKKGRRVKKVIGTDGGTKVGTLSGDFQCGNQEIENVSDYSNGRVNEKNHRLLLETIVEEQKPVPQREMVSNAQGEDLATRKKKTLIHLNSDPREIADECGLDLLDDMNTFEYSYTGSDNPNGSNESDELLESVGEPELNYTELVALPNSEIRSKEKQLGEEKIWEKIDALRAIVGYKAAKQSTTIEELKALYVFTGVEPPTSSDELSDIMDINEKLQFLMLIIGVK